MYESQHTIRAAHALHLIEVVKRWDVRGDELLAGTGMTRGALAHPLARIPIPVLTSLLERARRLTGEPALGMHIGLQTSPTLYGAVGFALLSAGTIREAIEISNRYGRLVTTAVTVRLQTEGPVASLVVDEHADFGSARDIAMMTTVVALWQISRQLTGRDLVTSMAEFAFPPPARPSELEAQGLRMRFDRPANRLTFDARSLALPYTMPDAVASQWAQERCQGELDVLGRNAELAARVRGLLASSGGSARGLEEVAAAMNQSPRTLKRHLRARGLSFSALRAGHVHERAMTLLRSADLSLDDVARRVGFTSVRNFERAFRRWTGTSPAEYRRTASARSTD